MSTRAMKWWTAWEIRVMRTLVDLVDDDEFARWFKATRKTVRSARRRNGIIRTTQRKRQCTGVRNSPATEFVKGKRPSNARVPGTIYVRNSHGKPCKMVSSEKGRPVPLHRHNWTQANGPIPKGHVLTFIDGDAMNCDLSNIRLMTRAENATRNSLKCDRAQRSTRIWDTRRKRAAYRAAKEVYVTPFLKRA